MDIRIIQLITTPMLIIQSRQEKPNSYPCPVIRAHQLGSKLMKPSQEQKSKYGVHKRNDPPMVNQKPI
jgi:hypothetical protein